MTQEEYDSHPGWKWCTSEGAELHTLLIGLQTTFREKLEWLEEAETLVLNMRRSREEHRKRERAALSGGATPAGLAKVTSAAGESLLPKIIPIPREEA